jgi:hypothetical protein
MICTTSNETILVKKLKNHKNDSNYTKNILKGFYRSMVKKYMAS